MPSLTRGEVEQIALLARLYLEPDEIEQMRGELGAILESFQAIAIADTTNVPAMTHAVPMDLRMRADAVEPSLPAEVAVAGAPAHDGEMFVVPAIIPGDGSESRPLHRGPGDGSESRPLHRGPGDGSESHPLHRGPGGES